jgi:hypothetical protein
VCDLWVGHSEKSDICNLPSKQEHYRIRSTKYSATANIKQIGPLTCSATRAAESCTSSSRFRFFAPITLVGTTALSIETEVKRFSPQAIGYNGEHRFHFHRCLQKLGDRLIWFAD